MEERVEAQKQDHFLEAEKLPLASLWKLRIPSTSDTDFWALR